MLEDGKISNLQFICAFVLSRLMLTMTYLSYFKAPPFNQDLWLSALLSAPMHILFMLPAYFLAQRFRNMSAVQSAEVILGPAGKLVSALFVWFFIHRTATILREFGEFFTAILYPETPILVFIGLTALFAAYAVKNGIETICRIAQIALPVILFSVLLIMALLVKVFDLRCILPVLEDGIAPVIYGAFVISSRTGMILAIPMLIPYINIPGKLKNYLIIGFVILAFYFCIIVLLTAGVFGIEQAKIIDFPFFYAVQLISVGDFLERIDVLFVAIWISGMFVHASIHYYLAVLGTAQLLKLQDYRPILLPMGIIIVSLSILQSENMVALNKFLSYKVYTWYVLFFTVILPSFLLLAAVIRKKGADSR